MGLILVFLTMFNFGMAAWNLDLYLDKGFWFNLAAVAVTIASGIYTLTIALRQ